MKKGSIIPVPVLITVIIIIVSTSCWQNKRSGAEISELPSLQPPDPPKAPTMVGADTIWDFSGQLPVLPGNEEALFAYIGKTLVYPESAAKEGIQGSIIVKFCVTGKGDVTSHEVVGSVDPRLDAEAMRVIKTITRFEPAYQNGVPVPVWYKVPITFKLQ